jgi:hypothetical protein
MDGTLASNASLLPQCHWNFGNINVYVLKNIYTNYLTNYSDTCRELGLTRCRKHPLSGGRRKGAPVHRLPPGGLHVMRYSTDPRGPSARPVADSTRGEDAEGLSKRGGF